MLKSKKRNAGITIEIALSIALSVVVLFLVLGLFSENLKVMMSKLGIKTNMFAAKRVSDAESWDLDRPTPEIINVQIAADNASLSSIHKQAQATIEELYKKSLVPPGLSDADKLALAEAMTKFAKSGRIGGPSALELLTSTPLSDGSNNYYNFADNNGIKMGLINEGWVDVGPSLSINLKSQVQNYNYTSHQDGITCTQEIGRVFSQYQNQ